MEEVELAKSELESYPGQFTLNKPEETFQLSPSILPSHGPERVAVQGYFHQPNGVLPIMEEKEDLCDNEENPSDDKMTLPEMEGGSVDLPDEWWATLKQAQLKLEANLPNSIKELLKQPMVPLSEIDPPNPSAETLDLTSAIQAISKRKRLRRTHRKRLRKQIEKAAQIDNQEKRPDIPFWWEDEEVAWYAQLNTNLSSSLF